MPYKLIKLSKNYQKVVNPCISQVAHGCLQTNPLTNTRKILISRSQVKSIMETFSF